MFRIARVILINAALFCAVSATAQDATLEQWWGEYPISELDLFPLDQEINGLGYIADQETWASVWSGFRSGPVPAVDFESELVLFARNVDFVNRLRLLSATVDEQGMAHVIVAETRTAIPIDDFVYWSAGTIPADGVFQLRSNGELLAIPGVPEPTGIALAAFALLGTVTWVRRHPMGSMRRE